MPAMTVSLPRIHFTIYIGVFGVMQHNSPKNSKSLKVRLGEQPWPWGTLIYYQFCPNEYFLTFDSSSISGISDPNWGKLNFIPILSKWEFQKL